MKKRVLILILSFTLVLACKDKEEEVITETPATTETAKGVTADEIKVNPAHGLPGHRCDLPVGAPLNQAAKPAETPISELPSTSVSPIRVNQTPELNPPHGEPYHDCSIPVGAKLKKT